MNVQPLGTRVLIKVLKPEARTPSGLILPETAQEKPQQGVVVAIAPDESIPVQVDDRVLFAKYSGTELRLDGEEYLILEANDILAKVQP